MTTKRDELKNDLAGQAFLITGAHGFIGAWVVKRLLKSDAHVVIFDSSADARRLRMIMSEEEISRAKMIQGDITVADALVPVIAGSGVSHIIHLAGLQVPTCRVNPRSGAMVNVVGSINVFEAALKTGHVNKIVYASSAAVFGTNDEDGPVTERDAPRPSTHYGAFKRCNEENARVYYLDHGLSSVGLRPLTVYGVGRDFGMTSDPTKAMKAAVVGRPYHIRFGGRTDFQYVADTANAFIRAATSDLTGAHVFNLHGETVEVAEIVAEIERAWPDARGRITCVDEPLPLPAEMDDAAIRTVIGEVTTTPLAEGVRATMSRFAELHREDRLETHDLDE
ncbi:MAG TPA: NAD-dependent epimerase/dehydratase family protein [Blastocatellia bacterium]|jgi:nucleoside-diphosphate-sugar epimerase